MLIGRLFAATNQSARRDSLDRVNRRAESPIQAQVARWQWIAFR